MKKHVLFLCFLITGICSSLVTDTSALYTKSYSFTGVPQVDYFAHGYLKYEYSSNKTCDYVVDGKESCTQGSVVYENSTGIISVSGDAGALRKYPRNQQLSSYEVNVHIAQNQPAELKNFGIYFNGSRAIHQDSGINALGYVLRFNEAGDLLITKEGYGNQGKLNDHGNDSILGVEGFEVEPVATKVDLDAMGLDPNNLDIKISVTCGTDDSVHVFVYLNEVQVNEKEILLSHNLNEHYIDGSGSGRIVGVSSYGSHSVVVTEISISNEVNR